MAKNRTYFIIDFDSTLVALEALDTLAAIALVEHPDKETILRTIQDITAHGMRGDIPFDESLRRRLALFRANKYHINKLVRVLTRHITPSVRRNKEFFCAHKDEIYVISGGFKDYILPILVPLGLNPDHILANEFVFDANGNITGFDPKNLLAKRGGKVLQVQALALTGPIVVVGDGYTDFQIKEAGVAHMFFAFCENIRRKEVVEKADMVVNNFDELVRFYDRQKVLLLERVHADAVDKFCKAGYDVEVVPCALTEEELIQKIPGVTALGIRSKTKITERVLAHADKLKVIGAFCIGTDQIDMAMCRKKGIAVFNDPFHNTRSVAELVIGEMIMLLRRTFEKSMKLHEGDWDKTDTGCYEIRGKKLGIIGYGHIGSQVSVLAEALGVQVYFFDVEEKVRLGNAVPCGSLAELLGLADVVTVHVDGRPENTHIIGDREFARMKKGACFMNLSRGFVVDDNALVRNLKTGQLGGAAVDVFPKEAQQGKKFVHDLQGLPNVILTPHIGGSTVEAQKNIGNYVADTMMRYLKKGVIA